MRIRRIRGFLKISYIRKKLIRIKLETDTMNGKVKCRQIGSAKKLNILKNRKRLIEIEPMRNT